MRILYINTLYYPYKVGGAEKSVQLLAEQMVKEGHEVFVCSLTNQKSRTDKVNGVKVHYLKLSNLYWPFKESKNSIWLKPFWHLLDLNNPLMIKKVNEVIKEIKPEIIHTHNLMGFSTDLWNYNDKLPSKLVHTLRDYYLLCPYSTMFKRGENCKESCMECSFFERFRKHQSTAVDAVTGISKFILDKHTEAGFFGKVNYKEVIPNPVKKLGEGELNQNFEVNENVISFGFMGRIEPEKGIKFLIESISNLPAKKFELLIAGEGEKSYVEELEKNLREEVTFIGYADAATFFNKIDVLIVPSLWQEPFGRVVIESYSTGTPVIGSKRGGLTDIIIENKTGLLFDPEQSSSLEQILMNIIEGKIQFDKDTIAENLEQFEVTNISRKYEQLYLSLFNRD